MTISDAKPKRMTEINAAHSQPHWPADGAEICMSRSTRLEADEPWQDLSRSGEANHRISRLTEMINWFDRYTSSQESEITLGVRQETAARRC